MIRLPDTQLHQVPLNGTDFTAARESVLAVLEPLVAAAKREPGLRGLRVGKLVSHQAGVEASLFVDEGWRDGAVVTVSCAHLPSSVDVFVTRSSRLVRAAVWLLLVGCVAGGVVVANRVWPAAEGNLPLGAGLLGGVALGVLGLMLLPRVPGFIGSRSVELAARLNHVVLSTLRR